LQKVSDDDFEAFLWKKFRLLARGIIKSISPNSQLLFSRF
jgi:hypothetical protein